MVSAYSFADVNKNVAKECRVPQDNASTVADSNKISAQSSSSSKTPATGYHSFTGKILGDGVRVRLAPDVDSNIANEMRKGDLIVVVGEKNDFYIIEPPSNLRLYIFRSFVLDNVVEGNKVNVRLAPELASPIVGFMSTGDKVDGIISEKNHKWLEIVPPKHIKFYIAKEFIEKVGPPEIKDVHEKKKGEVVKLMDTAGYLDNLKC